MSVSVVICTHNGLKRLQPTMAHLANQIVASNVPWEVLVVDNASTDGTADFVRQLWSQPVPLTIVHEPRLGVGQARRRGLEVARCDYVSFVDDDNWVAPDWIARVEAIFHGEPRLGAVGSCNKPVFEIDPPSWFRKFHLWFAVGRLVTVQNGLTDIWTSGMSIRGKAWRALKESGYRPLLVGRKGTRLSTGEDFELGYALQLAGWTVQHEAKMELKHFIPAARLNWQHLLARARAHGAASVWLGLYEIISKENPEKTIGRSGILWQWEIRRTLGRLRSLWREGMGRLGASREGDAGYLYFEEQLGRLSELLRARGKYDSALKSLWGAPWRAVQFSAEPPNMAESLIRRYV